MISQGCHFSGRSLNLGRGLPVCTYPPAPNSSVLIAQLCTFHSQIRAPRSHCHALETVLAAEKSQGLRRQPEGRQAPGKLGDRWGQVGREAGSHGGACGRKALGSLDRKRLLGLWNGSLLRTGTLDAQLRPLSPPLPKSWHRFEYKLLRAPLSDFLDPCQVRR